MEIGEAMINIRRWPAIRSIADEGKARLGASFSSILLDRLAVIGTVMNAVHRVVSRGPPGSWPSEARPRDGSLQRFEPRPPCFGLVL